MTATTVKPVARGDVVLVPIAFADLSGVKLRPALVVEADNFVSSFGDCLVATITSNTSRVSAASCLVLGSSELGRNAGLLQDSVILLDRITTIATRTIQRKIGRIEDLSEVDKALRHVFGV
jgi:mRNA interferase MazF